MTDKPLVGFTTPLYYANAKPHMGHLYTTLITETLARWHRMTGKEVFYITGSDEHGQKVLEAADAQGVKPIEWADQIIDYTKDLWSKYGITYDRFVRTTEEQHYTDVQDFFKRVLDNGYIYKGQYEGPYCVPCETFWTEGQLEDGNCPECARPTKVMAEESFFFKLSAFREWLIERIESKPEAIRPEGRRNEILSRLEKEELRDLSVSRSRMPWGVPLDFLESGHVCYVWFDALLGYMTAAKYGTDPDYFKRVWPNMLHLIGKDILWHHTVIWPAMQKAAGFEDDGISIGSFAHGFLIQGGEKMSKSKGNVLDPLPLLEIFTPDMLRYFILREVSFGQDGHISAEGIVQRVNSDLANDIGNLLHRSLSMLEKYTDGVVPEGEVPSEIVGWISGAYDSVLTNMQELKFKESLEDIWVLINKANKHIEDSKPWELAKCDSKDKLNAFLYELLDTIRAIAILAHPFIPGITQNMWSQLGYESKLEDVPYNEGGISGKLKAGQNTSKAGPIVPRIDMDEFGVKWEKHFGGDAADESGGEPVEPQKESIEFDEFMKIDLRVAKVLTAERVPKTDKLLKLEIDVGFETRTIIAGIAEHYEPEALIGKSIVTIANLAPRKLRGIESKGMLLAAHAEDGSFPLLVLDGDARPGSTVS